MTPEQEQQVLSELAELRSEVRSLRLVVGDWDTPPVLATGGTPAELPNKRYDLKESDFQVHSALDNLAGTGDNPGRVAILEQKVAALESGTPTGSTTTIVGVTEERVRQLIAEAIASIPQTGGTSVVDIPSDLASAVLTVLRANGMFCTDGKVGFGGEPVLDTDAAITIHGGQILGKTVANFQNPGATLENVFDLCNSDMGMRALLNCRWHKGVKIVPAPLRPVDYNDLSKGYEPNSDNVFALFDSHGESCVSDGRVRGQMVYLRHDPDAKTVTLGCFIPGWKLLLRESSAYGATDIPVAGT